MRRDVAALLDLAVLLHSHVTVGWLRVAGAAIELRELAAELATWVAEHRDTPQARGLAVWGGMHVMVMAGATDLARVELDSVSVPMRTTCETGCWRWPTGPGSPSAPSLRTLEASRCLAKVRW
jgi:hypothetical protein